MFQIRILVCFLSLVILVNGGGSDLPDDQVEGVLALYHKHCKSDNGGYGGYGGSQSSGGYGDSNSGGYGSSQNPGQNVNIVCKEGQDYFEPPKKQIIRIPAEKPKKQIVFVEAPAYKVRHDINLITNGENSPKTVIYVLPSKSSHHLNVVDNRDGPTNPQKPQVFFLKNNQVQQAPSTDYGPPQGYPSGPNPTYGPPQSAPNPTYGPPQSAPNPTYGPPQSAPNPMYGPPQSAPNPTYGPPQSSPIVPNPSYGLPSLHNEPYQTIPFDPSQLGPDYEIVPADSGTQQAYQNLFASVPIRNIQPQVQIESIQSQIEDHPPPVPIQSFQSISQIQDYQPQQSEQSHQSVKVTQTGKSVAAFNQDQFSNRQAPAPLVILPQEFSQPIEEEALVQPLQGNLFSSLNSNSAYRGRVIFPSESIQNSQVSLKQEKSSPLSEQDEDSRALRKLIEAYQSRGRILTTTTKSPTTKKPTPIPKSKPTTTTTPRATPTPRNRFNLFDADFVRSLIDSARNASAEANRNLNQRLRNSNRNLNSRNIREFSNSKSNFIFSPQIPSSIAHKRSVKPGFEIIPATFVSYSYSKSDIPSEKS